MMNFDVFEEKSTREERRNSQFLNSYNILENRSRKKKNKQTSLNKNTNDET